MTEAPDDVDTTIPSLSDWAGGPAVFAALTTRLYEKVQHDPALAPVFRDMGPDHARHVAQFICEVLGGPRAFSEAGGSHAHMISRHLGRHLTEAQRHQWMTLIIEAADETGMPEDPEFRSALIGYLEWGSRLAVLNSREGVAAPSADQPMPRWNWGPPGGPYRG